MENKINETDIIVGDEAENKSMFENKESMSTESADRSDSGIQANGMITSKPTNGSGSVSYTHLDVYKRQTVWCAPFNRCARLYTLSIVVFVGKHTWH